MSTAARSSRPSSLAQSLARLRRRLATPAPATGWSPPALPELIARIDGALAARRAD